MSTGQHADAERIILTDLNAGATLQEKNRIVGFWIFLAGECALFATLIGTYLGLVGQSMGGPTTHDVFDLVLVGIATVLLLSSSLTGVLSIIGMQRGDRRMMNFWIVFTLVLGAAFLAMQVFEFIHYYHEGLTFTSSAFGSAFYTLVGFHGGHVFFGLLWITALFIQSLDKEIDRDNASKFYISGLYWHFVDVVWVIIFTVVYLMGKVG